MNIKSLTEFGYEFQLRFFSQLLNDERFANEVMDVIESDYFENTHFRFIMQVIKEYYEKYYVVPDYDILKINIQNELEGVFETQPTFDTVDKIKETTLAHGDDIKEKALHFCRIQEIRKATEESKRILSKTPTDADLEKIPSLFDKAVLSGQQYQESVDVFDNVSNVLSKDYRNPIPSGIKGFDEITGGGFAKKEVVLGIAPLGVGKTTIMSYMANTIFNAGYNVLQIIFEDKEADIQRKHFSCWSNVPLSQVDDYPEYVHEAVSQNAQRENHLKIHKFPSSGVTFQKIRNLIKRWIASGVKIDAVVLDYLECVQKESGTGEQEWAGEGKLVRKFEGICDELNTLGITCTQGNRQSISSELVTTDQMGGELKKAQVAHFIFSIAKTLTQKEEGTASIGVLKSRIGKDGIVYENCTFNNDEMRIDTAEDELTMYEFENVQKDKAERKSQKILEETSKKVNGSV